jgi:excisionase family DNA binding protein
MPNAYVTAREEIRRSIEALQKVDVLLADKLDPLMTVEDVAAYWRCSVQHVYNTVSSGALKSVKIGGILRFHRADVLAIGVDVKA